MSERHQHFVFYTFTPRVGVSSPHTPLTHPHRGVNTFSRSVRGPGELVSVQIQSPAAAGLVTRVITELLCFSEDEMFLYTCLVRILFKQGCVYAHRFAAFKPLTKCSNWSCLLGEAQTSR